MAERTLKINADLTQLKVGLKELTTSIDRLSQKMDEMGQRTQQNMAKSTQGARNYKKSLDELQSELKQLEIGLQKAKDKHPFTRGRQKEIGDYKKRIADVNTQIDRLSQTICSKEERTVKKTYIVLNGGQVLTPDTDNDLDLILKEAANRVSQPRIGRTYTVDLAHRARLWGFDTIEEEVRDGINHSG